MNKQAVAEELVKVARLLSAVGSIDRDVPEISRKGVTIDWFYHVGGASTISKLNDAASNLEDKVRSDIKAIVKLIPNVVTDVIVDRCDGVEVFGQHSGRNGIFLSTWVTLALSPDADADSVDYDKVWETVRSL